MANFGAIVVVVLNIARLVSGLFNLVVIPFRDGINFKQVEEADSTGDRAGDHDRAGGARVRLHPVALERRHRVTESLSGHIRAGLEKIERKFEDVKEKASDKAKALGSAPDDKKPGPDVLFPGQSDLTLHEVFSRTHHVHIARRFVSHQRFARRRAHRSGAVDRARGRPARSESRPGFGVGLVQGSFASLVARDPLAPPPPAGLGRAFSHRRLRGLVSLEPIRTERPITGW